MPGKDSCPLFSCKSPTVSGSSPKQDPRPPFKLFLSLSPPSLNVNLSMHHLNFHHLPHNQPHLLLLTALDSYSTQTQTATQELSIPLPSCYILLLLPWGRIPVPLPYIPSPGLPTSPAILYLPIIAPSPANCSFTPWPGINPLSVRWAQRLNLKQ